MIVTCPSCDKNFDVDATLIPKEGRLVQCGFCDEKWFFKKETTSNKTINVRSSKPKEDKIDLDQNEESPIIQSDKKNEILEKKFNIGKVFKIFLLIIITFVSLIIVIDTFQNFLINYIPNINIFLDSLYETLTDIRLFIYDIF